MTRNEGKAATGSRQALLSETFVALADTLVDDYDVVDLMDRLTSTCVHLLDVSAAGLLLDDQRGRLQLVASSSEEVRLLELYQLQSEEGPSLDCIGTGQPVAADLESNGTTWPRFAAEARRCGYRSVYALPLRLRDEVIGGLNLFRSATPELTVDEQRIAQALADVATIGVLQQRSAHRSALVAEQLQTALDSRIVIEQAKGVLAAYAGLDMQQAYLALRQYSRDGNHKLSAVAESVVRRTVPLDDVVAARRR